MKYIIPAMLLFIASTGFSLHKIYVNNETKDQMTVNVTYVGEAVCKPDDLVIDANGKNKVIEAKACCTKSITVSSKRSDAGEPKEYKPGIFSQCSSFNVRIYNDFVIEVKKK
jgi:hypothetical protein